MGTGGHPDNATKPTKPEMPLFIGQGAHGEIEGTPASKEYGPGDGVMIAGDVRTLALSYCERGNKTIWYEEYPDLSHIPASVFPWLPRSIAWINDRFAGDRPPQNCSEIKKGNKLDPIKVQPTPTSSNTKPPTRPARRAAT